MIQFNSVVERLLCLGKLMVRELPGSEIVEITWRLNLAMAGQCR
jgi:hypothetical protein